jgi:SAM-dependent methyltransferase
MTGFWVEAIDLLRCTRDGGQLRLTSSAPHTHIDDGEASCASCGRAYPIDDGIVDLLLDDLPTDDDSRHEMNLREGEHQLVRGSPGSKMGWRDDAEIETVVERIGDVTGKTVLDLGCGPGAYTRKLVAAARLIGVDFSWTALRKNQKQLPKDARVGLVRADVATLRLAPGAFDLALATLYCNLPTRALRFHCNRTVKEALRPGGRYFVLAHHQDLRRVLKRLPDAGYYSSGGIFYQCLTPDALRAELDGFQVSAIDPVCIELPLVSRISNDPLRKWAAKRADRIPGINKFGSLLLATADKSGGC